MAFWKAGRAVLSLGNGGARLLEVVVLGFFVARDIGLMVFFRKEAELWVEGGFICRWGLVGWF